MSDYEYTFDDGDIIFKEGDRSRAAFVLVSGKVELIKKTANGPVRLALITPGEIFGEMGIIDRSTRSATARAVGKIVVEKVDRDGFLNSLQDEPDRALKVIGNLSERLRETNEMVISPASRKVLADAQQRPSIWTLIGGLIAKRRTKKRLLEVRIAPFVSDPEGAYSVQLAHLLDLEPEIHAALLPEPMPEQETVGDGRYLNSAISVGRQLLRRENADLLIHGEVNETQTALHMRFTSHRSELDQPGNFLITDRLSVPTTMKPEMVKLIVAAAVAGTVPRSEAYRLMMRPMLVNALEASKESGTEPPLELTLADQSTVHMVCGNILAVIGNHLDDINWHQKALASFQAAAEMLNPENAPVEWANAQYHLGRVRHSVGEKGGGRPVLDQALESYHAALDYFTKTDYPMEWALLQNRLGTLLYKTDPVNGDTENLKDAVAAFQSALHIINKGESPLKWSEVKNNLGQVLQVWGDAARSEELFERAILCCQEALSVRNREETPLLWAATQNNMGSALFLLGRMTGESDPMEGAAEAFGKALSIYQAYGAARLAKVSERNLARAEDVLRSRRERRVAKLDWEDEATEEREERLEQQRQRKERYVDAAE